MSSAPDLPEDFHTHGLWPDQASLVPIPALSTAQTAIEEAIEAGGMTCLHGDAGIGKTLAASLALRTTAHEQTIWPRFRVSPTARNLREELFRALPLDGPVPRRPAEVDSLLHEALACRRHVLVFDDMQYLNADCLRLIRSLWDDRDIHNRPAVVFIGDRRGYEKLRKELAARMYTWHQIDRLGADEVRTAMPAFHPEWAKVPLHLIDEADAYGPRGRMRSWVQLTKHCLRGMQRFGKDRIDEPLLRWALERAFGFPEDR